VTSLAIGAVASPVRVGVALATALAEHRKATIQFGSRAFTPLSQSTGSGRRPGLVTDDAGDAPVGAGTSKAGHLGVGELGSALLGTVALAAVSPQPTAVHVVLEVAVDTVLVAQVILVVGVARYAGDDLVPTLEGEASVVNRLAPRSIERRQRRVAPLAVVAQGTLVLVLVAVHAVNLAGPIHELRMTRLTVVPDFRLGVEADQREPSVLVVIEGQSTLATLDVAAGASLVRELAPMSVAVGVAADAVAFLVGEFAIGPGMALLAAKSSVPTQQGESEASVIDASTPKALPRNVTPGAVGGGPDHRVVRLVALTAGANPAPGLAARGVATPTTRRGMFAVENEAVVGVVDLGPAKFRGLRVAVHADCGA